LLQGFADGCFQVGLPYIAHRVVCFIVDFSSIFKKYQPYFYYTAILLLPVLIILFSNAGLFKAWGNYWDATQLKYLNNPTAARASIAHLPVTPILIGFELLFLLLYIFLKR